MKKINKKLTGIRLDEQKKTAYFNEEMKIVKKEVIKAKRERKYKRLSFSYILGIYYT